jgi:hypothetical protein
MGLPQFIACAAPGLDTSRKIAFRHAPETLRQFPDRPADPRGKEDQQPQRRDP